MLNDFDFRIANLSGGSLRNAIPRDAEAVLFMNKSVAENVSKDFTAALVEQVKSLRLEDL